MALYASNTSVPVDQSRHEIERLLEKYGASSFGYFSDELRAVVMFRAKNRSVRMVLPKPSARLNEAKRAKEDRRRWRSLVLIIKAKLEAIASGIATFEDEFLPYTVMADGKTVGEWAAPQLDQIVAPNPTLMLTGSTTP